MQRREPRDDFWKGKTMKSVFYVNKKASHRPRYRQSDQILVNDCTNAMNNPAGYNYNPWVNTQLLFASIFFTAAHGGF